MPLHVAAERGSLEAARFLLKEGRCVVDQPCRGLGATPLLYACSFLKSTEVVELLISHGADVKKKCPFPYIFAVVRIYLERKLRLKKEAVLEKQTVKENKSLSATSPQATSAASSSNSSPSTSTQHQQSSPDGSTTGSASPSASDTTTSAASSRTLNNDEDGGINTEVVDASTSTSSSSNSSNTTEEQSPKKEDEGESDPVAKATAAFREELRKAFAAWLLGHDFPNMEKYRVDCLQS
ncbi:unnamed protein product, partial [Amoebophrya sp. A25]|eukprot:GSA25T00014180001.1